MASIDSIAFDQASYDQGATITRDNRGYTPDSRERVPTTFTATATITDSLRARSSPRRSAPFMVNESAACW